MILQVLGVMGVGYFLMIPIPIACVRALFGVISWFALLPTILNRGVAQSDIAYVGSLVVLFCAACGTQLNYFDGIFSILISCCSWFLFLEDQMRFPSDEFLVDMLEKDTTQQSIQVTKPETIDETGAIRMKGMESHFQRQHKCFSPFVVLNLRDLLDRSERLFKNNIVSRTRAMNPDGSYGEYEGCSYATLFNRSKNFEGYLCRKVVKKIGVFSKNCEEYAVTMFAAMHAGIVLVPLYDSLGKDAIEYIINHCELEFICSSAANMESLLGTTQKCPTVRYVAVYNDHQNHFQIQSKTFGLVKVLSFETIIETSQLATEFRPISPDDIAYILYTSGTTGVPKGVLLSHGGFVACASALVTTVEVGETDVHLSYLPLAHCFEILVILAGVMKGASVGWYHGNVKELTDDAQSLRPTMFIGVPRVFQRIQQVIFQQFALKPSFIRRLCYHAVRSQILYTRKNPGKRLRLYDLAVFSQVKRALGGRVRIMCTGSAPMGLCVEELIGVCFDVPIVAGYGLTEVTGIATCTLGGVFGKFDLNVGNVGPPLPCCEYKIVSASELGYSISDQPCPRGEVAVRGLNVFKGYYNDEELTSSTLKDHWLLTGDIGRINLNGTLSIIDRRKNIFKLAQGEYVAAEKLETLFLGATTIGQIFVYGNSFENSLVAIVVPDPLGLIPRIRADQTVIPLCEVPVLSADLNSWLEPFHRLCSNNIFQPFIEEFILEEMNSIAKEAGLSGFEYIKAIHLEANLNHLLQGFSVENDMLTPTFKLKRKAIQSHYEDIIAQLYIKI